MSTSRRIAITQKQLKLRTNLWPDVPEEQLWNRKRKQGFTTIPRTMPIFMQIMDRMSKGKPVSAVYFELWCRAFDEHIVKLNNKEEMAFHSGFSGERSIQTWNKKIDILEKLGFIKLAPGPHGERSYALILNPYGVVKKHHENNNPLLVKSFYNALIERAGDIKADDI